jgi:acyl transferase domain-containing protein/SAM-dependent methyltransferase
MFQMRRVSTNSSNFKDMPPLKVPERENAAAHYAEDPHPSNAIAIIGMACKLPGADSLDEFWSTLCNGASMLTEVPPGRFGTLHNLRQKDDVKLWGNFITDIDAWDHKFFKKSAREAASMDPQQRHLLQVTYQAMQDSGYFWAAARPHDVGCYIGACSTDYDFNVASHPATAYSTVGTLRAFLSGRLSHYFGWSGPSLTIDTACSASAVAIHTACKALQTGECTQAVAGGVALFTSPYLFENLSTAHFLSQTGATKPFDAKADGYCRGEGIGVVVLKKLSDALADGDRIRGVVASTAVNQSSNCVPITVPHSSSQSMLFRKAAKDAGVDPLKVDFVEAHGTGTPVGDPIEMQSIREVFGGVNRTSQLYISSVKGAIGHLEGASGVAALIKAVLQIEKRLICPQASFERLNPKIPPLEPDRMCIPLRKQSLPDHRVTACINNYGAAGGNATLVLMEKPMIRQGEERHLASTSCKYPIQLTAASPNSLLAYCRALADWITVHHTAQQSQLLPNLAFSLAKHQDQGLSHILTTTSTDISQLHSQLCQQKPEGNLIKERPTEPPLVLCFGGQGADVIALDRRVWEHFTLLRFHLDTCHELLRDLEFPGIYPGIFQTEAIGDVVVLHTALFAMQYACAQSWIDSGLKVDYLVGHSLGQITALCVSGALSLKDALKFVAGRAALITEHWGTERGTMVVLDADEETTKNLMSGITRQDDRRQFEIACYNGTKCHVVVSDRESASFLMEEAARRGLRHKQLILEYGFHSRFTEDLWPYLPLLAESLEIRAPDIPVETCSPTASWATPTAELLAAHTREPVFFKQAVQRIHQKLGPSTWLEAGSNSTVVGLAARIVGTSTEKSNKFLPVALNNPNSTDQLVDTTIELWKRGHKLQFWAFHRLDHPKYDWLHLPPYTFEKHRHWLELVSNKATHPSTDNGSMSAIDLPPSLISLHKSDSQGHHFHVNPRSEEYKILAQGHAVLGRHTCPPSAYVELAARAAKAVGHAGAMLPELKDIAIGPPLRLDIETGVELVLQEQSDGWNFSIFSGGDKATYHASGTICLKGPSKALSEDFARFERLASHDTIMLIVNDQRSESIRGSMVYRVLSSVVKYADYYCGVLSVTARGNQVAGQVILPNALRNVIDSETILHPVLLNYFTQVAGIYANAMCAETGGQLYKLASIEVIRVGPEFKPLCGNSFEQTGYDVLVYTSPGLDKLANDIFVYEAATGRLVLYILGAVFARADVQSSGEQVSTTRLPDPAISPRSHPEQQHVANAPSAKVGDQAAQPPSTHIDIRAGICKVLQDIADIPPIEVKNDATYESLGLDSLLIIEAISELSSLWRIPLPFDDLIEQPDIRSLVTYLENLISGDGHVPSPEATKSTTSPVTIARTPDPVVVESIVPWSEQGTRKTFDNIRHSLDAYVHETGFEDFWRNVYPTQSELVSAYVVEAFAQLGCHLHQMGAGDPIPTMQVATKHKHLLARMHEILIDSNLLTHRDGICIRTATPVPTTTAAEQHQQMVERFPAHAAETKLLHVTAPHLADILTAKADPLRILFADATNKAILADVYEHAPMCQVATRILADFLHHATSTGTAGGTPRRAPHESLRIAEVGGGTGGTARYLVEFLDRQGLAFEYTFTDISGALVAAAKRKFRHLPQMRFATLDCNAAVTEELRGAFHVVVATNCIHATPHASRAAANVRQLLRDDGVFCLVEFTRSLYWFDLVYGLLEGWWLFDDGRTHALGDEAFWDASLRDAGFREVSWTEGRSRESQTIRLICAWP